MPALGDVIDVLETWYDPSWAEDWDAIGLVCGDRREQVHRVLVAVDPVAPVVEEAVDAGAQLLITHHPLLLTPVHGVPSDAPKGALVHALIRAGAAHYVAHTNADVAPQGVSDALAAALGLTDVRVLQPQEDTALHKLVIFVPAEAAQAVRDAVADAGAGRLGAYDRCAWTSSGTGTFRPLSGAEPAVGSIGTQSEVAEVRIETVLAASQRHAVIAALRAAHPYEEPAFDLLPMSPAPARRGLGRIGDLSETLPLASFAERVAAALPATAAGIRTSGDPRRPVRCVAVCGGSGSSLTGTAARAGADVFVTADLKHHPTLEQLTEQGRRPMALIDAGHWSTEAPWLELLAARMGTHFGATLRVEVSGRCTDPWSLHTASPARRSVAGQ